MGHVDGSGHVDDVTIDKIALGARRARFWVGPTLHLEIGRVTSLYKAPFVLNKSGARPWFQSFREARPGRGVRLFEVVAEPQDQHVSGDRLPQVSGSQHLG